MSAFMCSERHLTVLAAYAVRNRLSGIESAARYPSAAIAEVYGVLARENIASLDARYPGRHGATEGRMCEKALAEQVDAIAIVKACHCYTYQACEHSGWEDSQAKAIVDRIESHAVQHLPGYDAAPWGL